MASSPARTRAPGSDSFSTNVFPAAYEATGAFPQSPTSSGGGVEPGYDAWSYPSSDSADRPRTIPYRDGDPIPEGYRVESTPRYGLVAGGASIVGGAWLISTITAIALDQEQSVENDPNFDDMYTPMLIPVVGPFITIGTADASGTGAGILALDGVIQTAGLAMFIAGFAAPTLELVPTALPVKVTPVASPGMAGLNISGQL
jgi:hypothetical protein